MSDDVPSLSEAENWEVAQGSDGYGWRNVETYTNLGVLPSEDDDYEWMLTTDNHVLDWFDSKEAARRAAIEWMLDNPRPVNMG